jgi:perosamine synthetase
MGIGPGDEVILADTNWIATAAPIVHLGATPVFVDILPDTWCLDPNLIEEAITPRTRAVIATHLYGNLCDMDAILAVCSRHGVAVVEDAAEAIGSVYRCRRAGSMGLFGVFSFHGSKTLTTGEGGMFVTSDADLYERVLTLSNHGRARTQTRQFWPEVVGYKFKMSNAQAAIGCAQLERVEELVRRKRDILQYYADAFASIEKIFMNLERAETQIGAWMPTITFFDAQRSTADMILAALRDDLTDARPVFAPLSDLPTFRAQPENRVARQFAERAVNLPSFHDATEAQLERVVNVVRAVYVG